MSVREKLLDKCSYIAEILARRYNGRGIEYEDLYQVANIGLLYACDRFDPTRGAQFTTYATQVAIGEIKKHFRDTGNFIRVPRRMYEAFSRAERVHESMGYNVVSYEQAADDDGKLMPQNVIGQNDDSFLLIEDKDFIYRCLQSLTGEEHTFVVARYYDQMSQQQIADKMHVSQMYVSRLEKKVLKKLRDLYVKD